MEQPKKNFEDYNKLGLSKKTNIAIAAMGLLSASQTSLPAVIAISIVALVGICLQAKIDLKKVNNRKDIP